jgi:predicted SnoaL-like aldol condensation-catalyzing enzyme
MEKLKSRILYFSIILMSGFSLASCSKKVVYTSPVALSEDYISNLSKEKQMAFDFVTAAKNNVKLSSLTFAENFYSLDQQWNGNKTDYIQKRNAANFSTIKPIRIIQDDSLVAVHSRMLGMIREDGGASQFFNFGLYIQHNRHVGDGLNGLLWAMLKISLQGNKIKFVHNYHVMAEGNLVLSATEGFIGHRKTVFYDFFRVEDSKIVEHWDIITPVNEFHYFQME